MEWADMTVIPTALVAILGVVKAFDTEKKRADLERELVSLQGELKRAELVAAREESVRERLERQREPLIEAVDDLARRIRNIVDGAFFLYLDESDPHRKEMAELSTLYRFGKYFAAVEELRRGYDAWTLERSEETRGVETAIERVTRALASDAYPELMIWRDEQHAIGELMSHRETRAPIGYATFVSRYEGDLGRWFTRLRSDITAESVDESPRLREVLLALSALRQDLERLRKNE